MTVLVGGQSGMATGRVTGIGLRLCLDGRSHGGQGTAWCAGGNRNFTDHRGGLEGGLSCVRILREEPVLAAKVWSRIWQLYVATVLASATWRSDVTVMPGDHGAWLADRQAR